MSSSLARQGADEGAEEGANEGVLQERHVLVGAGGVQAHTGNCRKQIREEIHPWKSLLFDHIKLYFLGIYEYKIWWGRGTGIKYGWREGGTGL